MRTLQDMKKHNSRVIPKLLIGTGVMFVLMKKVATKLAADSTFENEPDERNPLEGKKVVFIENSSEAENADGARGHLEAVGESERQSSVYQKYIKRGIDTVLSFAGLVILSPILGVISLAIIIDDPGPVLFTQKRVGENKKYFKLHKFRSMKMSTPHDVPTHMLDNPDQYITRVGKFLRAHSLDELPQIWDIFAGNMSIIGPRPALWNQDVLTAERDQYGANNIKPGLTGWAQINGRDELELADKAKLDGDYMKRIRQGGIKAFLFDCRCFVGTIFSVALGEGVVEGGTGARQKALREGIPEGDPDTPFGCEMELFADTKAIKKVLITGAGSYIGESVKEYAAENYPAIDIVALDMLDASWREFDFTGFDSVYHVAGIAHADVGNVSDEIREKYYKVNTDLAIEVANKAKSEGVKQFVFMSSMIIYGAAESYGKIKRIVKTTKPAPDNFYGDSKWQADRGVRALADESFKVAVLRPPMIYGKGSKGNYPTLAKIAKTLPIFPDVNNERSMLYIENLCEFVCNLFLCGEGGIYFPQNEEYVKTSEMVRRIAETAGHKIIISKIFSPVVDIASKVPGKVGELTNKAFGSLSYNQDLSKYTFNYIVSSFETSIERTERDV